MDKSKAFGNKWIKLGINKRLSPVFGKNVSLVTKSIKCIRDRSTSIYKLEVKVKGKNVPVILKIYRKKYLDKNIEPYIYQHATKLFKCILPSIYFYE